MFIKTENNGHDKHAGTEYLNVAATALAAAALAAAALIALAAAAFATSARATVARATAAAVTGSPIPLQSTLCLRSLEWSGSGAGPPLRSRVLFPSLSSAPRPPFLAGS